MEYLVNSTNHFRLLLREHTGNSQEFRIAINLEINHFVTELEEFLSRRTDDKETNALNLVAVHALAEAMVIIVFHMGGVALDSSKKERTEVAKKAKLQLRMLLKGANLN